MTSAPHEDATQSERGAACDSIRMIPCILCAARHDCYELGGVIIGSREEPETDRMCRWDVQKEVQLDVLSNSILDVSIHCEDGFRGRPISIERKNMGVVSLKVASRDDLHTIWRMQTEAFAELLEHYQDHDMSPGAESYEKVLEKYEQPWTTYYFILAGEEKVGMVRVVDRKDGSRKRISPIWIMPEHRNKGYAQAAITSVEQIHGGSHWSLDTILQETGNLHLYEKMGYHRTGGNRKVNDRMDIVFYEKD